MVDKTMHVAINPMASLFLLGGLSKFWTMLAGGVATGKSNKACVSSGDSIVGSEIVSVQRCASNEQATITFPLQSSTEKAMYSRSWVGHVPLARAEPPRSRKCADYATHMRLADGFIVTVPTRRILQPSRGTRTIIFNRHSNNDSVLT